MRHPLSVLSALSSAPSAPGAPSSDAASGLWRMVGSLLMAASLGSTAGWVLSQAL